VITPGGRFTKDDPGIRELAEAIAAAGNRAVIWDRPNCGESDVRFTGPTESDMQADALAALLRHLDLGPTVLMGGSGGARVSLLAAANHPDVAAGLALLNISGGVFGFADSSERNARDDSVATLGVHGFAAHVGFGPAGRDAVDADAIRGELLRHRTHEEELRAFAGDV